MLGFNHVLESSSSSLGSSSMTDNSSNSEPSDDEEDCESNAFLKHLRKCFISIDENNYCEQTILNDMKVFNGANVGICLKKNPDFYKCILSKRIDSHSYELARSYNSNNSYHVSKKPWKFFQRMNSATSDVAELNDIESNTNKPDEPKVDIVDKVCASPVFECKKESTKPTPGVSALSKLLEEKSSEKNEFLAYSKHEAHVNDAGKTQNFRIFLPMCNTNEKKRREKSFIKVCIYKNLRISDLIGLICYKYTNEKLEPRLKYTNVESYNLKIADEDGYIEQELAPLESNQKVLRFGFSDLALVEKPNVEKSKESTAKVRVLVHFTDGSPNVQLDFENDNIPMETVYTKILELKLLEVKIYCPKITYKIEHVDQPGLAISLEKTFLSDFKSTNKYEFYFFRENSVRKLSMDENIFEQQPFESTKDVTRKITESSEYDVNYLSKWRKVPFKIELSKDNFELEEIKPVQITQLRLTSKRSNFYTIPMKFVVNCDYLKENNKSQIRVIVAEEEPNTKIQTVNYKHLDFECEPSKAEDIRNTFSQLIMFCNSPYLKLYNQSKKKSVKWSRRLFNAKKSY